jgi:hypothetical protein
MFKRKTNFDAAKDKISTSPQFYLILKIKHIIKVLRFTCLIFPFLSYIYNMQTLIHFCGPPTIAHKFTLYILLVFSLNIHKKNCRTHQKMLTLPQKFQKCETALRNNFQIWSLIKTVWPHLKKV